MKHAENTDRWIKWQNVSGSLPQNDMLIGYGNQSNKYMICNTCSRAKFKWDANLIGNIAEANREYIN